jgi:hypothetical protein
VIVIPPSPTFVASLFSARPTTQSPLSAAGTSVSSRLRRAYRCSFAQGVEDGTIRNDRGCESFGRCPSRAVYLLEAVREAYGETDDGCYDEKDTEREESWEAEFSCGPINGVR